LGVSREGAGEQQRWQKETKFHRHVLGESYQEWGL
jgi:hypothetical protein